MDEPEGPMRAAHVWLKSWAALSRLKGLRRLHIDLLLYYRDWAGRYDEIWKASGEKLLEVVQIVTVPEDFVVVLPNRQCSTDLPVGESKCKFRLPK